MHHKANQASNKKKADAKCKEHANNQSVGVKFTIADLHTVAAHIRGQVHALHAASLEAPSNEICRGSASSRCKVFSLCCHCSGRLLNICLIIQFFLYLFGCSSNSMRLTRVCHPLISTNYANFSYSHVCCVCKHAVFAQSRMFLTSSRSPHCVLL